MENSTSTIVPVWIIKTLSFVILTLTLYSTANIIKSAWFRFWGRFHMSKREQMEFYVKNKYDIKWSLSMTVVLALGTALSRIIGLQNQIWPELVCTFFFWLLSWGNYKTWSIEKERLNRRKDLET